MHHSDVSEPSWASCLVLVIGYDDVAPALSAAVEEAAGRLVLAPALGDFIELRFVSVGSRPPSGSDPGSLEARVVNEITRPTRGAPENYFGLVVVDDLAQSAGALLEACEGVLEHGGFHVRGRAFAVGAQQREADEGKASDRIAVLGSAPELTQRLASEILIFCDGLMRHYAGSPAPGLSRGDLEGRRAAVQAESLATLSAEIRPSGPLARPHGEAQGPVHSDAIAAPVFVATLGEVRRDQRRPWSRGCGVIRELDKRLAEDADRPTGPRFMVTSVPESTTVELTLTRAGTLGRRDIERPDGGSDLAQQLSSLHAALDQGDQDLARRGLTADERVAVLLAVDAPPADPVSTDLYERLAERASVVWVVPGGAVSLWRRAFAGDAVVALDDKSAADELHDHVLGAFGADRDSAPS